MRHRGVLAVVVLGMVLMLGWLDIARAAGMTLYLKGDGAPNASMSESSPPSRSLPDYDGEDGPGRTVKKNNGGSCEPHSHKYQQWAYQTAGLTVTAAELTIWAMPKGGKEDKDVRFVAYLFDSTLGCGTPLASATGVISDAEDWDKTILKLDLKQHEFAAGSSVIVKIRVHENSDDDMEFAYGTKQYDANLRLTTVTTTQPTTTTTKPTTTTTKPTTTTTTRVTTTTTQPTTTTTQPTTTTTKPTTTKPTTTTRPTAIGIATAPTTATPEANAAATTTTTTQPSTTTSSDNDDSLLIAGSNRGFSGPQVVRMSDSGTSPSTDTVVVASARDLKPQEGLMVAFSVAAETIELYWKAALALGGVMALLLTIGFRQVADRETSQLTLSRGSRSWN